MEKHVKMAYAKKKHVNQIQMDHAQTVENVWMGHVYYLHARRTERIVNVRKTRNVV